MMQGQYKRQSDGLTCLTMHYYLGMGMTPASGIAQDWAKPLETEQDNQAVYVVDQKEVYYANFTQI
jgi:hypothetical protein